MKQFSAVVFDMDGLLLDSEKMALSAFHAACDYFHIGDQTPVFMRLVGTNAVLSRQILQQGLDGLIDAALFSSKWDELYQQMLESGPAPLMPGARELLSHIKALGIPMAVATSTQTMRATQKLKAAGLLNYFEHVVGGDQVTHSKPAPEIYQMAATRLAVPAENCLALEDSANGVRAAHAAGMTVVQIPDLVQPDDDLLQLNHYILNELNALIGFEFDA